MSLKFQNKPAEQLTSNMKSRRLKSSHNSLALSDTEIFLRKHVENQEKKSSQQREKK